MYPLQDVDTKEGGGGGGPLIHGGRYLQYAWVYWVYGFFTILCSFIHTTALKVQTPYILKPIPYAFMNN